MDIDWLGYSYSVLAAAAFCHFSTFEVVHKVSGESDPVLIVTDVTLAFGGSANFVCVRVRPDVGQCGPLCSVDDALRGHAASRSHASTQRLSKSES